MLGFKVQMTTKEQGQKAEAATLSRRFVAGGCGSGKNSTSLMCFCSLKMVLPSHEGLSA
jgi:hypothetical protein